MYCDRCGAKLEERNLFCPNGGRSMAITPLMPVHSRLSGHMRLLAIFWFAISAFRLIPGLFLVAIFSSGFVPAGAPPFVPGLLVVIGFLFILLAVIGLAVGWGLLQRRPSARTFAITVACFNLIDMPFGTALGVYSLWVLLPAKSEQEYRQIAQAA